MSRRPGTWRDERPLYRREPYSHEKNPVSERLAEQSLHPGKWRYARPPLPFHRNFEEINLRFYVRRQAAEGWRRAVVFVKEVAPRRRLPGWHQCGTMPIASNSNHASAWRRRWWRRPWELRHLQTTPAQ
ncbi:MAG: DUF2071 domain-containing protein [Anaerolineae bacterium]|nr:MAG: DUF2071 domain-containing protein [Anaerolineae bacterium]